MTLSDLTPNPCFEVTINLQVEYLKNGRVCDMSKRRSPMMRSNVFIVQLTNAR